MIEIEEVLEASTASGFSTGQTLEDLDLDLLVSRSRASITRSQSPRSESFGALAIRASAFCRSVSVIAPLESWRAMLPLIVRGPP